MGVPSACSTEARLHDVRKQGHGMKAQIYWQNVEVRTIFVRHPEGDSIGLKKPCKIQVKKQGRSSHRHPYREVS